MTREAIVKAATQLETTHDLLDLLNEIKMSEFGEKGHPFIMSHFNFFLHPSRNQKSYKSFKIPKKSGGFREISAPQKLLKSLLSCTNKLLQSFYEGPEFVTGFVPGKCVVDNAERHIRMNYVFNTDLKDFFPSINKSRVWATLKCPPFNFNKTIANAIAGLCCTEMVIDEEKKWVLPQGSPCSPILTNIVCRNLDRQLHRLAKKYHLHYSRYADDITFSSNRNVFQKDGDFQQELIKVITAHHFSINEKKTRLQKKGHRQEVTGLVVSDRVNVAREYVRGLDNLLYIWEKYGEDEAYSKFLTHYTPKQNLHTHIPNMRAVIRGKLQYLKMVKGEDNEVWRKLQRRFNNLTSAKATTVDATPIYRYFIRDFEKIIGAQLNFSVDNDRILCGFTLKDRRTTVSISKSVRERLKEFLLTNDIANIRDEIVKSCILVFYAQNSECYWRIERRRSWSKADTIGLSSLGALLPLAVISGKDADTVSGIMKSTEEVLAALVESNFDLNILDEWDMIKTT